MLRHAVLFGLMAAVVAFSPYVQSVRSQAAKPRISSGFTATFAVHKYSPSTVGINAQTRTKHTHVPLRVAAAAVLLPLSAAAEEVTAFKASGAADVLGSIEFGVFILGIAVRTQRGL